MASPSEREQLMLELVNRARLDPAAEARRLKIGLNEGLAPGTVNGTTKAPLAMNELLIDSSRAHSTWMLDTDIFSHTGQGGSNPGDRMEDAGYSFTAPSAAGENISWTGTTGTLDLGAAIRSQHDGLFKSPGHRTNILSDDFREIGVGQVVGEFDGYNASMVTQNFARSGNTLFLTGVVYTDSSSDDFYSLGEGRAGIKIAADGRSTASTASGGYDLAIDTGKTVVTFGSGVKAVKAELVVTGENAKVDFVDGKTLMSSVSLKLLTKGKAATLLGLDNLSLTGASGAETLIGNKGKNYLSGGSGGDRLNGMEGADKLAGGAGNDRLGGGTGSDVLTGGAGADILTGGTGADTFAFRAKADFMFSAKGRDTILDFSRAQKDKIDLKTIDADTGANGNQKFKFLAAKQFTKDAGELRYQNKSGDTFVYGDINGDGKADFAIKLDASVTLKASDFVL